MYTCMCIYIYIYIYVLCFCPGIGAGIYFSTLRCFEKAMVLEKSFFFASSATAVPKPSRSPYSQQCGGCDGGGGDGGGGAGGGGGGGGGGGNHFFCGDSWG